MRKRLGLVMTASLALATCAHGPRAIQTQPVARYGQLSVAGHRIVDRNGNAVQLAGMSLFWSVWGGERFFNADVVRWLASDWRCSVVRAPVAVEPTGGMLTHPDAAKARVRTVVDAAIEQGLYVIIDWHEEHADQHVADAQAFFEAMAKDYGRQPNVLFELWNEPAGNDAPIPTWADIKNYAEKVIPVIRKYSPNLIVVGTPFWSQRVDQAADDPIAGPNIAYALHFYAGSHGRDLREKADYALSRGVPLFITEWGTTNADGGNSDKKVYVGAAQEWLDWATRHQLSWANWSVMDKQEASSILFHDDETEDDPDKGGWEKHRLTESGRWVREKIRQAAR
jgi:endoglucanase